MHLYITNGDCFNEYFLKEYPHKAAVPFREAMMDGACCQPIFSDAFMRLRADVHGISQEVYRASVAPLLSHFNGRHPKRITLLFGKDTFCQMNLLTLLSFLEEIDYGGEIFFTPIDDESFAALAPTTPVALHGYRALFQTLLCSHKLPNDSLGVIDPHAVDLYLDFRAPNGALAQMIAAEDEKDEESLLLRLLPKTYAYGLSDTLLRKKIRELRSY